jgi:pyrroline-5-carboxylate reductase
MTGIRLGFVGTGNIASAVATGFATADPRPAAITVSPRNAGKAGALAARFPGMVSVAADNQAVIDASDWLILSVRPQDARAVLTPLRFRADQVVISLIATWGADALGELVAPASRIVRAVPLPCVAQHAGPIAITPPDAEVEALFRRIGVPIALADGHQFQALWALTSLIAPHYTMVETAAAWAMAQGVPQPSAERYAMAMFHGLSLPLAAGHHRPSELAAEAQTPRGLNEQVLRELTAAGTWRELAASLDRILARLEGRAKPY